MKEIDQIFQSESSYSSLKISLLRHISRRSCTYNEQINAFISNGNRLTGFQKDLSPELTIFFDILPVT